MYCQCFEGGNIFHINGNCATEKFIKIEGLFLILLSA